ncbi:MAG TPA: LuxR C-terminal-related transcriptional regulator [Frankiaceae bacterium]|nr:LuxR C-terminal-related transcriptional regulator [Frankiaceae bacterium]
MRTLREAASQAVAQGDMESAAQMLTRAVAEPPVSTERVGLLLELAAAQDYRSDITAEATIREALVLSTAGAERARALTALARFRFNRGEHVAAVQAYDQAFGETGTAGPAAEQLFAEYLTAHIFRAQLHPLGQARLSSVIEAAEQGNPPLDPGLLAHLALRTAFGGGSTDRVRVLAERATARDPLVDPRTRGFFAGMLVQALACVDELVLAEQIADAAITASRQRGSRPAHETASYHRAIPRYHMGALSAALGDLEQALVAADEGWSGSAWVLSLQTHIYLAQGAPAAARKALDRHPELVTGTMDASILLFAKARVELAEGNSATALSDSSEAGRQLAEDFGIDHPGFIAWRETAALAAAGTGDLKLAHELAVEALERARAVAGRRSVSLALRTAAAVSTDDPGATERIDLLSEAASMVEDHPAILERAYTLVDLGAELRAGGHLTAARSALRGGLQISDAIGARALAEKARGQLRATGARPRRAAQTGADALTPAERRVAEIAASGLTNPQIAQDLFVTTKTVETHLANAFRKLGINSRRELPAAFTS